MGDRTSPLWKVLLRESPELANMSDREVRALVEQANGTDPFAWPRQVVVYLPGGDCDTGRVVASHVKTADGLCGIGDPREGAPPAIVEFRGVPIMFGVDGWELSTWNKPAPRETARCLCPEAGASEVPS